MTKHFFFKKKIGRQAVFVELELDDCRIAVASMHLESLSSAPLRKTQLLMTSEILKQKEFDLAIIW